MSSTQPAAQHMRQRRRTAAGPSERGSASIQMVLLLPVLFTVMFLGMQAALFYHARSVAIAAAQEGARASSAQDGSGGAGVAAAASFVAAAGGCCCEPAVDTNNTSRATAMGGMGREHLIPTAPLWAWPACDVCPYQRD